MTGAPRQLALDALRGIAILSVLLFHFHKPSGIAPVDALLAPFGNAGWAGVDLFFVLSGYLVGGVILAQAHAPAGFDWRGFLVRRAFRLWPILYLYLATLMLVGFGWEQLWPAMLHLQNYHDDGPSHLWSLAVEEHFYLAAAFLLPLAARGGPRRVVTVLIAVIVAATVLRIGALQLGMTPRLAQWQTQFRADALAVGVLLAAWRRYRPDSFARAAAQRGRMLVIALLGFGWLATGLGQVTQWGPGLTVAWLSAAALVLAASGLEGQAAGPATRAMAALGLVAYPLYVWHASVGQAAAAALGSFGLDAPLVTLAIELVSAILAARLLHRWVEAPFLALRDHPTLTRRRTRRPATATT